MPAFALADTVSALYAVIGALLCLYQRDARKSGRGQSIDVSLLEEPGVTLLEKPIDLSAFRKAVQDSLSARSLATQREAVATTTGV